MIRVKIVNVFKEKYDYLLEVVIHCLACKRRQAGTVRVTKSGAVREIGCRKCKEHKPVRLEF